MSFSFLEIWPDVPLECDIPLPTFMRLADRNIVVIPAFELPTWVWGQGEMDAVWIWSMAKRWALPSCDGNPFWLLVSAIKNRSSMWGLGWKSTCKLGALPYGTALPSPWQLEHPHYCLHFTSPPCWAHAPSYPHLWTKAQDTEFLYLAASHSNPLCWGRTLKPQTLEAGSDCPTFRCKLLQCIWRSQPASVAAWSRRSRTTHCTNLFSSSIIPPLILCMCNASP